MQLSSYDQFEIECYFKIDERISDIQQHIKWLEKMFYDQTMTSHIVYNGQEVRSIAYSLESNVIPFVDTIRARDEAIERLTKKKRYLNDYLNSLVPEEKEYLVDKYSNRPTSSNVQQADIDLLEEIHEINDAINFMYGFPVDPRETREIDNSKLEDDFDAIAALIGV